MKPPILTIGGLSSRRSPADRQPRAWSDLEAESHRDDVRERIRDAVRAGTVRVRPCPEDPERVQVIASPLDRP
jgi:hypothetical protein